MKCIKQRGKQPSPQTTMRVSDQYARECTDPETGDSVYIPKRIWKQFNRDIES